MIMNKQIIDEMFDGIKVEGGSTYGDVELIDIVKTMKGEHYEDERKREFVDLLYKLLTLK